jgi:hypothetical protein
MVIEPAASVGGDTPGCVSRVEFNGVDFWDSKKEGHRILDTVGWRVENNEYGETRQYRTCKGSPRSYATVDYKFGRQGVWFKWLYIETCNLLQFSAAPAGSWMEAEVSAAMRGAKRLYRGG